MNSGLEDVNATHVWISMKRQTCVYARWGLEI